MQDSLNVTQRSKMRRSWLSAMACLAVIVSPLHGCSRDKGGANLAAFTDGKSFLNSVRFNENPELNRTFKAFAKAGVVLPPALNAVLSGKPVVDDGIKEARKAAASQISGDNASLRAAGVPESIPLVDPAKLAVTNLGNGSQLALNEQGTLGSDQVDIDGGTSAGGENGGGNGGGGGAGGQREQCVQVNAACHARAVAVAAAFACAFASAWACVYSEVQPFRSLCTWAYAGACTAAMSVAVSEVHASTTVEVCNMCPAGGGNMPLPAPSPVTNQ